MSASERFFVLKVIRAHVFGEFWYATCMTQMQLPGLQVVRRAAVNVQVGLSPLGNYKNGHLAVLDRTKSIRETANLSGNTSNLRAHCSTVGGALCPRSLFADQQLFWPGACLPGGLQMLAGGYLTNG